MRILRFLSGAAAGLMACLVFLELFLRASGTTIPSFVQDDERFGRVLRPRTPLLFVNEGFYLGDVNEWGYLGPAYPPEKPEGVVRVALLGDSYVEGFQLFDREHLRRRLEGALDGDGGRRVEVLNFGFSGFNFPRMFHYWREFVTGFDPDLVLFFVGEDDFLQPSTDLGPRFRAEGDSLVVDLGFRETPTFRRKMRFQAGRDFAFYTLFKKTYQLHRQGRTPAILLDKLHPAVAAAAAENDWNEAAGPGDPARERVNELMLRELGRAHRDGDARIAFVVKRPLGPRYPALLRENGLPLLDPSPGLEALLQGGVDPQWWPAVSRRGHWNARGHEAIAEQIAPGVRSLLRRTS